MTYHVFAGETYYAAGPVRDFVGAYDDIQEALRAAVAASAEDEYVLVCDFEARRAVLIGEAPHGHRDDGWQVWHIGTDFGRGGLTGLISIMDFRAKISGAVADVFLQPTPFLDALKRDGKVK